MRVLRGRHNLWLLIAGILAALHAGPLHASGTEEPSAGALQCITKGLREQISETPAVARAAPIFPIALDSRPSSRWSHPSADDAVVDADRGHKLGPTAKYRKPFTETVLGTRVSGALSGYLSAHPEASAATWTFDDQFYHELETNPNASWKPGFQKASSDTLKNYLNAFEARRAEGASFSDPEMRVIDRETMERLAGHLIAQKVRFAANSSRDGELVFSISPDGSSPINRWVRHLQRTLGKDIRVLCWPGDLREGAGGSAHWRQERKMIVLSPKVLVDPESLFVVVHESAHANADLAHPGSVLRGFVFQDAMASLTPKERSEWATLERQLDRIRERGSAHPAEALRQEGERLFVRQTELYEKMQSLQQRTADPWMGIYDPYYSFDEMNAYDRNLKWELGQLARSPVLQNRKTGEWIWPDLLDHIRVASSITRRSAEIAAQLSEQASHGRLNYRLTQDPSGGTGAELEVRIEGKPYKVLVPVSAKEMADRTKLDAHLRSQIDELRETGKRYLVFYRFLQIAYDHMARAQTPAQAESMAQALSKSWMSPRRSGFPSTLQALISTFNRAQTASK